MILKSLTLALTCADLLITPVARDPAVRNGPWLTHCASVPGVCRVTQSRAINLGRQIGWVKLHVTRGDDFGLKIDIETPPLITRNAALFIDHTYQIDFDDAACDDQRCRLTKTVDFKKAKVFGDADTLTLKITPWTGLTIRVAFSTEALRTVMKLLPYEL